MEIQRRKKRKSNDSPNSIMFVVISFLFDSKCHRCKAWKIHGKVKKHRPLGPAMSYPNYEQLGEFLKPE